MLHLYETDVAFIVLAMFIIAVIMERLMSMRGVKVDALEYLGVLSEQPKRVEQVQCEMCHSTGGFVFRSDVARALSFLANNNIIVEEFKLVKKQKFFALHGGWHDDLIAFYSIDNAKLPHELPSLPEAPEPLRPDPMEA